jgi:hypothetical protein
MPARKSASWTRLGLLVTTLLAASATVSAQSVTPAQEFNTRIQQRSSISTLDGSLFGDHIGLGRGSFELVQTDVDLPGNSALAVRMGRRFTPDSVAAEGGGGHFGGFEMDIPNVHGVFDGSAAVMAWRTGFPSFADADRRCSLFGAPPTYNNGQGAFFAPEEYWQGSFFYLPGVGDEELLQRSSSDTHIPSDGMAYPVVTREGAVSRCIPLAATSQTGAQGEGFEIVTPDGTVYTLDHMVTRHASTLDKWDPEPQFLLPGTKAKDAPKMIVHPGPSLSVDYVMMRQEVLIYPSKVTDRFGNSVTYTWSANNPWQLLQISANDGRHLDITYPDATSHWVKTVSDGTRTWQYAGTVTLPDGSSWSNGVVEGHITSPQPSEVTCDSVIDGGGYGFTIGSTSPSGVSAEFTISPVVMGRSWVNRECIGSPYGHRVRNPYVFVTMAITKKKLTGPGLPASGLIWTYSYGAPNNCWDPASYGASAGVVCTSTSPITHTTTVTAPDGAVTRYTFGNRDRVDEGLLLKTDYGWNGVSALRTVENTYADPEAVPYATFNGASVRNAGDYNITRLPHPIRQVTTTQQGRTFTWQVASGCDGLPYCFDAFARPTKVAKTSSP